MDRQMPIPGLGQPASIKSLQLRALTLREQLANLEHRVLTLELEVTLLKIQMEKGS